MIPVTEEMLDRVERRTAHQLAGLGDGPSEAIRKSNADGTSYVAYEPPPLPSGTELLAQFVEEGRDLKSPAFLVAKEAAIAERLLLTRASEEAE